MWNGFLNIHLHPFTLQINFTTSLSLLLSLPLSLVYTNGRLPSVVYRATVVRSLPLHVSLTLPLSQPSPHSHTPLSYFFPFPSRSTSPTSPSPFSISPFDLYLQTLSPPSPLSIPGCSLSHSLSFTPFSLLSLPLSIGLALFSSPHYLYKFPLLIISVSKKFTIFISYNSITFIGFHYYSFTFN